MFEDKIGRNEEITQQVDLSKSSITMHVCRRRNILQWRGVNTNMLLHARKTLDGVVIVSGNLGSYLGLSNTARLRATYTHLSIFYTISSPPKTDLKKT